jgi:hypothetical protein
MQVKGIYRVSGNKGDVESVQQKFEEDPNKDFSELGLTIHAVAGALKSFFTKLPGALIPNSHYDGIIAATSKLNRPCSRSIRRHSVDVRYEQTQSTSNELCE